MNRIKSKKFGLVQLSQLFQFGLVGKNSDFCFLISIWFRPELTECSLLALNENVADDIALDAQVAMLVVWHKKGPRIVQYNSLSLLSSTWLKKRVNGLIKKEVEIHQTGAPMAGEWLLTLGTAPRGNDMLEFRWV